MMKLETPTPPTLEEARKRLHDQSSERWRERMYGLRISKRPAWRLIKAASMADTVFPRRKDLPPVGINSPDYWRTEAIQTLGSWLLDVIRTKNGARELEELACCLKARRQDNQYTKGPPTYEFYLALSGFLHQTDWKRFEECIRSRDEEAFKVEQAKGTVPTLAQMRHKLGWTPQEVYRIAKKLGWTDLPKGEAGKPAKLSRKQKEKK